MKNIKTIALIYALFTYCSACYGDIFKINRIGPEILEACLLYTSPSPRDS